MNRSRLHILCQLAAVVLLGTMLVPLSHAQAQGHGGWSGGGGWHGGGGGGGWHGGGWGGGWGWGPDVFFGFAPPPAYYYPPPVYYPYGPYYGYGGYPYPPSYPYGYASPGGSPSSQPNPYYGNAQPGYRVAPLDPNNCGTPDEPKPCSRR